MASNRDELQKGVNRSSTEARLRAGGTKASFLRCSSVLSKSSTSNLLLKISELTCCASVRR